MKHFFYILTFAILSGTFFSCSDGSMYKSKPTAFGPVSQLNVVVDKESYNSPLLDTISYYFAAPYPILPQPEPQFDVRMLEVDKFYSTPLTKSLRSFMFLTSLDNADSEIRNIFKDRFSSEIDLGEKGYRIKIIDDYWAQGQLFVYIIGKDDEALMRAIQEGHTSIISKVKEFDEDLIASAAFMEGRSRILEKLVKDRYNLKMEVPGKYQKAISNDTLTWLRFNQEKSISSIVIVSEKYVGKEQFEKEYVTEWTKEVIRDNIQGPEEDAYMILNESDLPILYETKGESEMYTGKLKAIWEMENAFMGGALVSKAIYKPGTKDILLVIGFVYAPGETKREYMQRVEYIIDQIQVGS